MKRAITTGPESAKDQVSAKTICEGTPRCTPGTKKKKASIRANLRGTFVQCNELPTKLPPYFVARAKAARHAAS